MIKTYEEIYNEMCVIVEDEPGGGVFSQIVLSDEQFKKIVDIINASKRGFDVPVSEAKFVPLEDYD